MNLLSKNCDDPVYESVYKNHYTQVNRPTIDKALSHLWIPVQLLTYNNIWAGLKKEINEPFIQR